MLSTYFVQAVAVIFATFCFSQAIDAWHSHEEARVLFLCLLGFISGVLFTFQFIIRAKLKGSR